MGSSSVLVRIGSDSCCNSFVVNQFPFSHQMEKIPFVIHPRRNESNAVEKMFCLFFISKIYSRVTKMSGKNGNGDTLMLVLEATSYQTKIFRHI